MFKSKTIWAVIVSLAASVASKYGYAVDVELQDSIVQAVLDVVSYAAGVGAIYGRVKATKKIGK